MQIKVTLEPDNGTEPMSIVLDDYSVKLENVIEEMEPYHYDRWKQYRKTGKVKIIIEGTRPSLRPS